MFILFSRNPAWTPQLNIYWLIPTLTFIHSSESSIYHKLKLNNYLNLLQKYSSINVFWTPTVKVFLVCGFPSGSNRRWFSSQQISAADLRTKCSSRCRSSPLSGTNWRATSACTVLLCWGGTCGPRRPEDRSTFLQLSEELWILQVWFSSDKSHFYISKSDIDVVVTAITQVYVESYNGKNRNLIHCWFCRFFHL